MRSNCPCPSAGMSANPIRDPERLAALRRLSFLDSCAEPEFDRITGSAARALNAPVALLTLVDDQRQWFKSCVGLSEPWATVRETPLSHSFCRFVVAAGRPLALDDARRHPLLCDHPAIADVGVVAYLGVPLRAPSGITLGALCVVDGRPREWTAVEIDHLEDLAAWATVEIERREKEDKCRSLEQELATVARERAAHELWSRASTSERSMVSYLLHEVSTPLTIIQGFSEMIRDQPLSVSEIREYATHICQEATLVNELISRTRDRYRREIDQIAAAENSPFETATPPPAATGPPPAQ